LFIPPFWKTRGVYSFSTDDSKIIPKKTKKVKEDKPLRAGAKGLGLKGLGFKD
jgi:hypothetical protein